MYCIYTDTPLPTGYSHKGVLRKTVRMYMVFVYEEEMSTCALLCFASFGLRQRALLDLPAFQPEHLCACFLWTKSSP